MLANPGGYQDSNLLTCWIYMMYILGSDHNMQVSYTNSFGEISPGSLPEWSECSQGSHEVWCAGANPGLAATPKSTE